jgi:hypothetical protein
MWYYRQEGNKLYHISGDTIKHFRRATGWQHTRSTTTYQFTREETSLSTYPHKIPTSVILLSRNNVNRLQEGPPLLLISSDPTLFWDFIAKWGGNWMWEGIDATQQTKTDTTWIAMGMKGRTLIWMTDMSYNRKRANDLSGVGWIIFCTKTSLQLF